MIRGDRYITCKTDKIWWANIEYEKDTFYANYNLFSLVSVHYYKTEYDKYGDPYIRTTSEAEFNHARILSLDPLARELF